MPRQTIPLREAYPDLQKMLDDKNARIKDLENQVADLDRAVKECTLNMVGDILNNILAAYIKARFDHAELGKVVESILGLAIVKPRSLEDLDKVASGVKKMEFTITPVIHECDHDWECVDEIEDADGDGFIRSRMWECKKCHASRVTQTRHGC